MTSADDKVRDAPARKKRILPRGGKWPSEASQAEMDEPQPSAAVPRTNQKKQQNKRRPNPARELWAKAQAAAWAARLLIDAGDWDGAVNRAYYAVFSSARAVLAGVRANLSDSKGHGTIVRRFEKHLVEDRGLDRAFGRPFFGRLSHARWVADYGDVRIDETAARAMLDEAERFVCAVEPFLKKARA